MWNRNNSMKLLQYIFLIMAALLGSAAASPTWQIFDSDMPVPVAGGAAIVYNDKIYIFGGYSDSLKSPVDLVQEFNPAAPEGERWAIAGRMQAPRGNFVAGLYGDNVYISGGRFGLGRDKDPAMEIFSFAERTSRLGEENLLLIRIGATGLVWRNLLLIMGGYYSSAAVDVPPYLIIYNLDEEKIVKVVDDFPKLVHYDQVSALVKDRLFVFGGIRLGVSNRVYELNLTNFQFNRIHPDLKRPLAGFTAVTALNDTVYLIGGYNENMKSDRSIIQFYATARGFEFEDSEQALNIPRRELMAVYLDSSLYVFGGRGAYEIVAEVERYSFKEQQASAVKDKPSPVVDFRLRQNYPNPFNSTTTIVFELSRTEQVRLEIFTADGVLLRTLTDGVRNAGPVSLTWDGADAWGVAVPSGVYFYRLVTSSAAQTKKMLLVK